MCCFAVQVQFVGRTQEQNEVVILRLSRCTNPTGAAGSTGHSQLAAVRGRSRPACSGHPLDAAGDTTQAASGRPDSAPAAPCRMAQRRTGPAPLAESDPVHRENTAPGGRSVATRIPAVQIAPGMVVVAARAVVVVVRAAALVVVLILAIAVVPPAFVEGLPGEASRASSVWRVASAGLVEAGGIVEVVGPALRVVVRIAPLGLEGVSPERYRLTAKSILGIPRVAPSSITREGRKRILAAASSPRDRALALRRQLGIHVGSPIRHRSGRSLRRRSRKLFERKIVIV
eukprot:scaffold7525_cov248-Pinguiococcus_pyrenoidosus.AAC.2